MPIHDQGYRRYGGGGQRAASGVAGHRPRRHPDVFGKRAFLGLLLIGLAAVLRPRRADLRWPPTCRRRRSSAPTAETFREFLDQQEIFVFFVTVYVGAGLIANDRRANALQIYLSKPLTRAEYVVRQAGRPDDVPAAGHLGAGDRPAARPGRCSPAASRSSANNIFLFPAITVFAFVAGAWSSPSTMLALSSLSKSSRYVGILYAASSSSRRRIYGVLCVDDAQHRRCRWISLSANLDAGRRPDLPAAAATTTRPGRCRLLVDRRAGRAVSALVLERRVRGVEVVA